ncbi:helix-turn-helix transcriptional regulator [Zavarzinia aquatilis]|nr:LuxR C-terminal-related transcriptional regulator [Zavarzinia aquatilis]
MSEVTAEASGARSIDENSFIGAGRFEPPRYAFTLAPTRVMQSFEAAGPLPKVTTIVAPTGYGKTVLMTQIHRLATASGARTFWLGIDDREADLPMILTLVEHAIGLSRLDLNSASIEDPRGSLPHRVDRMIAHLARLPGEVVIFIDNINSCSDPGLSLLLDALTFRTPNTVKFCVTSTDPVPFDSGRARIEMKLRRITVSELGFDFSTTAAMLRASGLDHLSNEHIATVVSKTEGWPAAIRLIQLILSNEGDNTEGLEHFSGADADLAALLSRRLIASFDPDLVDFLHDIAELRGFSVELAAAATGNPRAAHWVRFLVERNVLIVPLDRGQTWFRFHSLFRQFLLADAAGRQTPERRRQVLLAATEWLRAKGDRAYALELALAAPLPEQASAILEQLARPMVRDRGDLSTFTQWVEQAKTLGATLGLDTLLWYAWALAFNRHYERAGVTLDELAGRIREVAPDDDGKGPLWSPHRMAQIIFNFHLDRMDAVRAEAPGWLADYPDAGTFDFAAVAGAYAIASAIMHDFQTARRALRLAQDSIIRVRSDYGLSWVASVSAIVELMQGDPIEAERNLRDAEEQVRSNIGDSAAIVSVLTLGRARAAADTGRITEAVEMVRQAIEQGINEGILDTAWFGIEVALQCPDSGEDQRNIEVLQSMARRYARRLPFLVELALIRCALRHGRTADAMDKAEALSIWSRPAGFHPEALTGFSAMERSAATLAGIDLLMAAGSLREAETLIEQELRSAQDTGRRRDQIELHLLQTAFMLRSDNQDGAIKALARAVVTASKRHLMRSFLEQRDLVVQVIQSTPMKKFGLTLPADLAFFAKICDALGVSPAASRPQTADNDGYIVEAPTPREIELLQLLDSGLDNSQIASRLSLSVPTVKWHLYNIYSKLGVKNRAGALAKARALRVLHRQ